MSEKNDAESVILRGLRVIAICIVLCTTGVLLWGTISTFGRNPDCLTPWGKISFGGEPPIELLR